MTDPEAALDLIDLRSMRAFSTPKPEARRLVAACREQRGASVITSPMIVLHDGQRGHISVVNQTAYISGFEIEVQDDVSIADPVVDVFADGLLLETRADVLPDPNQVRLSIELALADLEKPIPSYDLPISGGATKMTIQQPVATTQKLETRVELERDECLVLIAEDFRNENNLLLTLVTARQLSADEVENMNVTDEALEAAELFGFDSKWSDAVRSARDE